MMPSETLRTEISNDMLHDLTRFAWGRDLKNLVFGIQLDEYYESEVKTMEDVYRLGLNIGHCGLTSRYLARACDEAELIYGKFKPLAGTNKSPVGEHAWILLDNYVIDTTLMIAIPAAVAQALGYEFEKVINYDGARMLPEYESFSQELHSREQEQQNSKVLVKQNLSVQRMQVM